MHNPEEELAILRAKASQLETAILLYEIKNQILRVEIRHLTCKMGGEMVIPSFQHLVPVRQTA